jgi:hypothetical protein
MTEIDCDKLPYEFAKSLYNQTIMIKELNTGRTFPAFVVDYCFEDEFGVIVRIEKHLVSDFIRKYDMVEAERNPATHVECDMRNTFMGKHFAFVAPTH